MSAIVFLQNKNNPNLWSVIDNLTGDIKGVISSYKYLSSGNIEHIAYEFCYTDVKGKLGIKAVDELSQAQQFFINEVV